MSDYTCEWCGTVVERKWEIPSGAKRDSSEWVCNECHTCYFDEDCDHEKRSNTRTI